MAGILNTLRKIHLSLVESIYKSEKRIEREYNIKIKNYNVNVLYLDKNSKKFIKPLFEEFGFVRGDLFLPFAETSTPTASHKYLIRAMKPYLSEEDLSTIITSASIVRLEDKDMDEEANKLLRNLSDKHGERGRRIYNMLRSNHFEKLIVPFVENCESEIDDPMNIYDIVNEYFNRIIEYHPFGIWVNETTSDKELVEGLEERVIKHKMPIVFVYGRGDNCVEKIKNTCDEFCKRYEEKHGKKLEINYQDYKLRKVSACEVKIMRKNKKKGKRRN